MIQREAMQRGPRIEQYGRTAQGELRLIKSSVNPTKVSCGNTDKAY